MAAFPSLRGKRARVAMSLLAALAFAMQGYDQGLVNGLLTLPTWIKLFPQIDTVNTTGKTKDHNAKLQGMVIGIYEIGCAIGAVILGLAGDRLGRRKTIFLASAITLVGAIIQATPFTLAQLIVGRFVNGFGIGAITASVPMWVSECTKAANRGTLIMLQGWFGVGGLALVVWIEFGLFYVKGDNSVNFRFPIALQCVFALIILSVIYFMPESPRWLIKRDRMEDARAAMAVLEDSAVDDDRVTDELAVMRFTLIEESRSNGSKSAFALTQNRHLHRTMLAIFVNFVAQMSGISVVTFYSTTIFETDLKFSGSTSRVISASLQLWQFFAAGLAVLLIDRFGRRPLLIITATGMCISQFCLGGLSSDITNKSAGSASIFFFFFALFFFPIGFLLVPFMYAAEIAPLQTRATVTGLAAATNWIFSFAVAEITPVAFTNIGWKYYFVYGSIDAAAIVVFILFYPETKGRTLEDIDQCFIQSKSIFDTVRVTREMPIGDVVTMSKLNEGTAKEPFSSHVEQIA